MTHSCAYTKSSLDILVRSSYNLQPQGILFRVKLKVTLSERYHGIPNAMISFRQSVMKKLQSTASRQREEQLVVRPKGVKAPCRKVSSRNQHNRQPIRHREEQLVARPKGGTENIVYEL